MNVQRALLGSHQVPGGAGGASGGRTSSTAFAEALERSRGKLVFSAHARSRLASRRIELTEEMIGKLNTAVQSAERKGARDSLVLLSNLAFIINVPNKTVVTAMDGGEMKEHIITNIDSTVIAG